VTPSPQRSTAFQAFEINFQRLTILPAFPLKQIQAESTRNTDAVAAAIQTLGKARDTGEGPHLQPIYDHVMVQMEGVRSFFKEVQKEIDASTFLTSWKIVILVSFTEAYVEDAFRIVMAKRLAPDGRDLLQITSTRKDFTRPWVDSIIRAGTAEWIKMFTKLGVVGYRDNLADELGKTWKRRNDIVHQPRLETMTAQEGEFVNALDAVQHFVLTTDEFIVQVESR
jgi:hypothetical protein